MQFTVEVFCQILPLPASLPRVSAASYAFSETQILLSKQRPCGESGTCRIEGSPVSLSSSRKSASDCSLLERLWKHVRLAFSKWLKMLKGGVAAEANTADSLVLGEKQSHLIRSWTRRCSCDVKQVKGPVAAFSPFHPNQIFVLFVR